MYCMLGLLWLPITPHWHDGDLPFRVPRLIALSEVSISISMASYTWAKASSKTVSACCFVMGNECFGTESRIHQPYGFSVVNLFFTCHLFILCVFVHIQLSLNVTTGPNQQWLWQIKWLLVNVALIYNNSEAIFQCTTGFLVYLCISM